MQAFVLMGGGTLGEESPPKPAATAKPSRAPACPGCSICRPKHAQQAAGVMAEQQVVRFRPPGILVSNEAGISCLDAGHEPPSRHLSTRFSWAREGILLD